MKQKNISLSLEAAAREFRCSKATLLRGLQSMGVETKRGTLHDLPTLFRALAGNLNAEKTRETKARADLLEMKRRTQLGELIPLAENLEWQRRVIAPFSLRLNMLPTTMADRCNPIDPSFARRALNEWVTETLPILRAEITKITETNEGT